jgi:two-component system OmpR family response regulator
MRPDRVLLVDDEVAFLEVFSERLQSRGLEVSAVTSGEEAVRLAKTKTFDAVVLDLAMPGMDGLETLRQLLAVQPHLQVMILTGQATLQAAVEATRLGAVDIFEKPTDIETLLARIRLARAKRLALEERNTEEEISEILRTRGW